MFILSPTGKGIRQVDKWGSGIFGAPRGNSKKHNGADFICEPGQAIFAPVPGVIVREALPYAGSLYSGLLMNNKQIELMLFYLKPDKRLIGQAVRQGQRIGTAENIAVKYPGIIPHIHLRIVKIDPALLLNSESLNPESLNLELLNP